MAPYDSDSSGGEDEDFTETNVLLGYASKDPGDDSISRLGGRPVSYPGNGCLRIGTYVESTPGMVRPRYPAVVSLSKMQHLQ
ncbi:hypothetical protein O1611_g7406 [Lasiodiplodia mahajangana]|uniref:Uncharacterized protein n=1 Tax=Lasiodiplodia mahajangana TaxID=1108764 RepID=A0ACC2JFT9_9PEZI|nr:hypothetical protein O1611_g7406 [Lasiodiplodia mahajangana]